MRMKETFEELQNKFILIKEKGYIKGIYNDSSAIGRTFEDELGLKRNKESVPDYKGIEIKTRRAYSKSYITLFNAAPNGENENELSRLKDRYGYPCKKDRKYKVIYLEVFGNKLNYGGIKYQYKLEVNRQDKKIYLCIYNEKEELIEKEIYWSFDYLKQKLENKLSYLAIINAWPTKIDNWNYFKYYKIKFYVLKRFEKFLKLIEQGYIKLVIKIGIYLDEEHYGKMYDHGCGFTILEEDIDKLFYEYILSSNRLI